MIALPSFVIVAAATLLLAGSPAEKKAPAPLTGGFDPEDVLLNLERIVQRRDWQRYGDYLAADFRFIPYSGVYQEIPPVPWDLWDREWELKFIERLLSPTRGASLSLLEKVLDRGPESGDRAEWDLVYHLVSGGVQFRSRAIFVFVKVDNRWFLREWIDTTVETDPLSGGLLQTSGSLRGAIKKGEF
jgi:hypothetical protein